MILVLLLMLLCPVEVEAGEVYCESEYVSESVQDVIFSVLEEPKYKEMDRDCAYLIVAIIERESRGQQYVVSHTGDYGYCQINLAVHRDRMRDLGVSNIFDTRQNIRLCVDILYDLFNMYDGWTNVLMHYNGTKNASALYRQGIYSDYAKSIMSRYYTIKSAVDEEKRIRAEKLEEKKRNAYIKNYKANLPCRAGAVKEVMRIVGGNLAWNTK